MSLRKIGKFCVALLVASVVFSSCLLCACVKCSHENMEFVERKPATCTEEGAREHWRCKDCGKIFSDESAQHETYVVIPQGNHSYAYAWNDEQHYRECVVCHSVDQYSYYNHILKYSAADDDKHFLTCYCGYEGEHEDHVPDEEKGMLCTLCHYGGNNYKLSDDGSYYIYTGVASDEGAAAQKVMKEFAIPDEYLGLPVKEVGDRAFANCEELEKVTLGANIVSIGDRAFMYCNKLTTVKLNEGLREIQSDAFIQCPSLEEIELPSGLKILGNSVFKECKALKKVNIPEGVTQINPQLFYDCTSLEKVELHSKITSIGLAAFSRSGVKEMTVPDGVKEIPQTMFEGCPSLESVTIPASVTSIGTGSLMNCPKLTTINFQGTQAQWNAIQFNNFPVEWDRGSVNYTIKFAG